MKIKEERICVVGAGLVGTLASLYLAKRGYQVDLFEKRSDMRVDHIPAGRSIVMSVSARGVRALEGVGLAEEILEHTLPKLGRTVHMLDGSLKFQQYGRDHNSINTIDREVLNCVLMDRAEATGRIRIFFNYQCAYLDADSGKIEFLNTETGATDIRQYDHIIGADGIFSSVRAALEDRRVVKTKLATHSYGYRELVIPPLENGDWALANNCVHIWPRKDLMMLAIPRIDHAFTITLFLPLEGQNSFDRLQNEEQVVRFFQENFPQTYKYIPTLTEDFFANDTANIFSVRCSPWHYKDRVVIMGDASHAVVPFFAMGMNAGFEDCTVFDNLLERHKGNFSKVLPEFSAIRKPDMDALADMSSRNFYELGKCPDPNYDIRWSLERRLWDVMPERWIPQYAMIAFSHIPLAEVEDRSEAQERILDELVSGHLTIDLGDDDQLRSTVSASLS